MELFAWVVLVFGVVVAAFLNGMEVAYTAANKIYLELEKKHESSLSRALDVLTARPDVYLTSLIWNRCCALLFSVGAAYYLMQLYGSVEWIEVAAFVLIGWLVLMLLVGLLPKIFATTYANTWIRIGALPSYWLYRISYLPAYTLWNGVRNWLNADPKTMLDALDTVRFGTVQKVIPVDANEQEQVDSEMQIFQNAMDFSGTKTKDIMTPRTELVAVDVTTPIAALRQLFVDTGFSKIIIYNGNVDAILGYVHSFALFSNPKKIEEVVIPIEFMAPSTYAKDALNQLLRTKKSMAVILDEFGGTAGIITTEDIIEELFGEIEDEHDQTALRSVQVLAEKVYKLSARLEVSEVNEALEIDLPESDAYTTIGGMLVERFHRIPKTGETVELDQGIFTILSSNEKKIEWVKFAAK